MPIQPLRFGGALAVGAIACAAIAACSGFTSSSTEIQADDAGVIDGGDLPAFDAVVEVPDSGAKRPPFYKSSIDVKDGCPNERGPKMVLSNGRCVDATEVSESQYAAAVNADLNAVPRYGYCDKSVAAAPSDAGALPVANITWCDANAYCSWAGKHL